MISKRQIFSSITRPIFQFISKRRITNSQVLYFPAAKYFDINNPTLHGIPFSEIEQHGISRKGTRLTEEPTTQIKELQKNLNLISASHLFTRALTHKSYGNVPNYEKLEFIGKNVLNMVVSEVILHKYYESVRGSQKTLNLLQALYTNETRMYLLANKWNIERALRVNGWDVMNKLKKKEILASSMYAIIGSIFQDSGPRKAKQFINSKIITERPSTIFSELMALSDPINTFEDLITALTLQPPKKMFVFLNHF